MELYGSFGGIKCRIFFTLLIWYRSDLDAFCFVSVICKYSNSYYPNNYSWSIDLLYWNRIGFTNFGAFSGTLTEYVRIYSCGQDPDQVECYTGEDSVEIESPFDESSGSSIDSAEKCWKLTEGFFVLIPYPLVIELSCTDSDENHREMNTRVCWVEARSSGEVVLLQSTLVAFEE